MSEGSNSNEMDILESIHDFEHAFAIESPEDVQMALAINRMSKEVDGYMQRQIAHVNKMVQGVFFLSVSLFLSLSLSTILTLS